MVSFRTEGYFTVCQHQDLSVIGVEGILDNSLEEVRAKFSGDPSFEVAPVKKERGRDSLAMVVRDKSFRDLTLDRDRSSKATIVIYSLNKTKSLETMDYLLQQMPFYPREFAEGVLIQTIGSEFSTGVRSYDLCLAAAKKLKIKPEQAFSAARYTNFLIRYCNVDGRRAIEMTKERLGINF